MARLKATMDRPGFRTIRFATVKTVSNSSCRGPMNRVVKISPKVMFYAPSFAVSSRSLASR